MAIVSLDRAVGTNYYNTNYSKGNQKFRQRALVLRFMEKYLPDAHHPPALLTMPGEDWLFEQMFLQHYPHATLVGVERSGVTYRRARLRIPCNALAYLFKRDEVQDRDIPYGRSSILYSRVSNGLGEDGLCAIKDRRRRANRLVLMDVNDYVSLLTEDHGASLRERRVFVQKFYQRDAVWLDYTGTLTERTLKAIGSLHYCMADTPYPKPVVITVVNGRDRFQSKDDRVAAIKKVQPLLEIQRVWTYQGANGISMLTVCGTIL